MKRRRHPGPKPSARRPRLVVLAAWDGPPGAAEAVPIVAELRPGEPRYAPLVRSLLRQHARQIRPGATVECRVYHDGSCPALAGGVCACDPRVDLVERTV